MFAMIILWILNECHPSNLFAPHPPCTDAIIALLILLSLNDGGKRAGPVNNFGKSRENREMGQDGEWDNGYETAPNTALHYDTLLSTALHIIKIHNSLGYTQLPQHYIATLMVEFV